MKFKALQFSENLQSSYWLYPLTFAFLAFVLLTITLMFDDNILQLYTTQLPFFDIDVLRKVLGIIITSSISITSVIFSITVLTLSLTSNQLGPRLLPTFINQGKTQLVIATFIGIYVYCLLLLAISSMGTDKHYLLSLFVGVILGMLSFIALIYFIHYVCKAIQIEHFLTYLSQSLAMSLNRVLLSTKPEVELKESRSRQTLNQLSDICSEHTGYIQAIEYEKLLDVATHHDSDIEITYRPGHFITEGIVIAHVSNRHIDIAALQSDINQCILVGIKRTLVQDIEYGFEQIVEIAVRALSPGINNPYTAICCINQLTFLLTTLSRKFIAADYLVSDQRVVYFKQFTYEGIINTALDQLRFHAAGYCSVTIALLTMIKQVLSVNKQWEITLSLKRQAKILFETAQQQNFHAEDMKDIEVIYHQI